MDAQRRYAYRWVLYEATLEIRSLQGVGRLWQERFNPICWGRQLRQIRRAGAIADWLHNLALFSALDFAEFDEDRFWRDFQWLLEHYPGDGLERYRTIFDERVSSCEASDT